MRAALILILALAACGRPLAPPERAFLAAVAGDSLDSRSLRIHGGFHPITATYPAPQRDTCQSRLYPPYTSKTIRGSSPAITLFNHVFLRDDRYSDEFTDGYPANLDLDNAMLLLHESIHAWQWQHRRETHYTPIRAGLEHFASADPYLFDTRTTAAFGSFGYEQQASIVEEYLCCRVLAPEAERTLRLHRMLAQDFSLTPLGTPIARQVTLPWRGVTIKGILRLARRRQPAAFQKRAHPRHPAAEPGVERVRLLGAASRQDVALQPRRHRRIEGIARLLEGREGIGIHHLGPHVAVVARRNSRRRQRHARNAASHAASGSHAASRSAPASAACGAIGSAGAGPSWNPRSTSAEAMYSTVWNPMS